MRLAVLTALALLPLMGYAADGRWQSDSVLGDPFQAASIGDATLVRLKAPDCAQKGRRRAILYVHGYNDYFFQDSLARELSRQGCVDFYAMDLHGYGRSIRPGQRPFDASDMEGYYADLDSALAVMTRQDGVREVVLMGHSTGGLITASYMSQPGRRRDPGPITGLILNSPFLDWNMNPALEAVGVPTVVTAAALAPGLSIPQAGGDAYAQSLRADSGHGQWQYRTDWKMPQSPAVTARWVRTINQAQEGLRQQVAPVLVPVLLAHSDRSVSGAEWTPDHQRGDAVLDVREINRLGRALGPTVTEVTIPGGLHDLALSEAAPRDAYIRAILRWLARP